MNRKEMAEAFNRAVWQDTIARLTAEGKLPPLPVEMDIIGTHIGYENLEPADDAPCIQR